RPAPIRSLATPLPGDLPCDGRGLSLAAVRERGPARDRGGSPVVRRAERARILAVDGCGASAAPAPLGPLRQSSVGLPDRVPSLGALLLPTHGLRAEVRAAADGQPDARRR